MVDVDRAWVAGAEQLENWRQRTAEAREGSPSAFLATVSHGEDGRLVARWPGLGVEATGATPREVVGALLVALDLHEAMSAQPGEMSVAGIEEFLKPVLVDSVELTGTIGEEPCSEAATLEQLRQEIADAIPDSGLPWLLRRTLDEAFVAAFAAGAAVHDGGKLRLALCRYYVASAVSLDVAPPAGEG